MTATRCRACRRPIHDRASQERGYGPDCWREKRAIEHHLDQAPTRVGRRHAWAADMPGQEHLELEPDRSAA